MNTSDTHLASPGSATWRDYFELRNPKVVSLIVFTAVVGMFLAVPGMPPLAALVFGTLGGRPLTPENHWAATYTPDGRTAWLVGRGGRITKVEF